MNGVSLTDKQAHDLVAWDFCTEKAAARFSEQQETAEAVAEAALADCRTEEASYFIAETECYKQKGLIITYAHMSDLKRDKMSDLMARVMNKRATTQ